MDEQNGQPDTDDRNGRSGHDSIAASIELAAGAVTVPDPVDLRRDVQSTFERRRRRRRGALTGVVGATALVAGLTVVAVVGDDGPVDRLVSAPVDSEPADSVPEPDDSTGASESVGQSPDQSADESVATEAPAISAPVSSSGPIRFTGASSQLVTDDAAAGIENGGAELFAWNDGFLAVRRSSTAQTLPEELPEELAAAFPQDVLDLFPDGLPDTLQEATEVLQEAGLYDVVAEIVLSNDEVRDAIYADQPELVTSVRFSVDGVDWNDIEADLPSGENGYPIRQVVAGDRFVVVTEPAYDSADTGRYFDIHVSSDLVEWEVQRLELPERAEQRGVQYYVQLDGFAADESGWIASVSAYPDIAVADLLPEGDVADLDVSQADGGWVDAGYDDTGVYVERYDGEGNSTERRTYTWAEVGLDGPPLSDMVEDRVGFVSGWNGVPQQVDVAGSLRGLDRFGDGFVQFGDRMQVSPDGLEWTDVALPVDGWVSWVLDTADGLLVSTGGPDGSDHHLLDPDTMTWTPVQLPDVPSGAQMDAPTGGSGAIVLADYDEPDFIQPSTIRLTAESDGYALTVVLDMSAPATAGAANYEVVDVASGDVLVSESVDAFEGFDVFTSIRDVGNGGFAVDDPDTGEELVRFPQSDIVNESLDENGDVLPEPDFESYEPDPDHWVVAAVSDGVLVEQVPTDSGWVSGAAVQGDTVLVAAADGSFVRLTSQ